jgi:hypothetical protein
MIGERDRALLAAVGFTDIANEFGDRLGEARAAMEASATSLPPEELNGVEFRLSSSIVQCCGWGRRGGVVG